MTKKITLFLLMFFLLYSCGKKGDPTYKAHKIITKISNSHIDKV